MHPMYYIIQELIITSLQVAAAWSLVLKLVISDVMDHTVVDARNKDIFTIRYNGYRSS